MLGLDPSHRLGSFGWRKIVHTRPHDYCLKNCIGKEYPNWESIGYRQEDLQITAGWAHAGKDGVTMPGRGKSIEREYTKDERQALLAGTKALGISEGETLQRLGETTFDIYLNDDVAWKNVPARVWEFYIGGYQVMKKWLSYREFQILGRAVTPDEAREVTAMARRLAALCLLQPALDENYRRVKESAFPWGTLGKPTD